MGCAPERLEAVLSGEAPMNLDELILLSETLGLDAHDLGVSPAPAGDVDALPYDPPETPRDPADDPDVVALPFTAETDDDLDLTDVVDPDGNQILQLFQVGFTLGCTFFFQAATDQLQDSGIPSAVLRRYAGAQVPIQLDAAYHVYNEPVFSADGVTLKLSFDAIYTCTFPWSSIQRVSFFPEAPEPDDEPDEDEEEPPTPSGAPFLRLVE